MDWVTTPEDAAAAAEGAHFVSAELMYRPRPAAGLAQAVFDACWRRRMAALNARDAVLLLAASPLVLASLEPLIAEQPALRWIAAEVNPEAAPRFDPARPRAWGWETPARWRQFRTTDRWARLRFALQTAAALRGDAFLLLPAHDAIYGRRLLEMLEAAAHAHTCSGLPAAVSPYTPWQHAPLDDLPIPPDIIAAMNAAFARSGNMALKIARDEVQAFWGKMSLLPARGAGLLLAEVSLTVWEDDKEIDRALRDLGLCARALYTPDRALYQQTPPVFTRADLKRVIERTIHYSLNIPGSPLGASSLNRPLDASGRLRALVSPRFRRAARLAQALIDETMQEISARLAATGVSWVDWGAYRHVVRVGDPDVEVWGRFDSDSR